MDHVMSNIDLYRAFRAATDSALLTGRAFTERESLIVAAWRHLTPNQRTEARNAAKG